MQKHFFAKEAYFQLGASEPMRSENFLVRLHKNAVPQKGYLLTALGQSRFDSTAVTATLYEKS